MLSVFKSKNKLDSKKVAPSSYKETSVSEKNKNSNISPYLSAKLAWNERYGAEIREKKIWQISCVIFIISTVFLVIYVSYLNANSKYIPYALKINELAQTVSVEKLDPNTKIDPKIISSQLAQFVSDLRTVTTDGNLKKKMQEHVYSLVSNKDGASSLNTVDDFWKKNDPFEIAKVMNISVLVTSVMPLNGSNSYQIQWTETAVVNGVEREKINWRGLFEISRTNLSSWGEILNNPTGLLIKSISWTQVI